MLELFEAFFTHALGVFQNTTLITLQRLFMMAMAVVSIIRSRGTKGFSTEPVQLVRRILVLQISPNL